MTEMGALAAEDVAILDLECATVVGHTGKIVRLAPGPVDVESIRARVAARIDRAPELTRRLGGTASAPTWVEDDGFDLNRHVVAAPTTEPLDDTGLARVISSLFADHLPRDRPLWRMDVAPLADGGAAVIWRLHHTLADGVTALRLARAVLWDETTPSSAATRAAASAQDVRRRWHLAGFIGREFTESRASSPFDGVIGSRREVGFAALSLAQLRAAAQPVDGATVNDVLLSVVAGAVRRWVEAQHATVSDLRVRVPVSLHRVDDTSANQDSFFSLNVPLHVSDPIERLRVVHRSTMLRKSYHDAEQEDVLLRDLSGVPALRRFVTRLQASPRQFAVCVSNVPGPREPVAIFGVAVRSLSSIVEIGERHALRVAAVSLGDHLSLGFCADPAIVVDVASMATAAETEAAQMTATG